MAPCCMAPAAEATAEWPEVLDAEGFLIEFTSSRPMTRDSDDD